MAYRCEYCRETKSTHCGDPPAPCIDGMAVKEDTTFVKEHPTLESRGFKKVGCYCIGIYVNAKTGQFIMQPEDCCDCP